MIEAFMNEHQLPETFEQTAEKYYKPLAEKIYHQFSIGDKTYFVGINGCQGSGKSTLTEFVSEYLVEKYHLNVVVMSLDDFYFSREQRKQLALEVHPLLATRGVPGTHDVNALKSILNKLHQKDSNFFIPKFNKATDDPFPKEEWEWISQPADIVILEGWCWGVEPQSKEQLNEPINELEYQQDQDGVWRKYVNQKLTDDYEPLYKTMDFWLALQAPSFDTVYQWRLEQEQKLKDKNPDITNSKIMSPSEVLNFTQYFQRLSVQGCKTMTPTADAVFYLNTSREISEEHAASHI